MIDDTTCSSINPPRSDQVDLREQLVNDRQTGLIHEVSVAKSLITSLHGIMMDVDAKLIRPSAFGLERPLSPQELYTQAVRPWLDRHPTPAKAHVRCSGNGLHILLKLETPVEFQTASDREHWDTIAKIIQCCLPTDPQCRGITVMTRPIGSVNGKTNTEVIEFSPGQPIPACELEELAQQLSDKPFSTIASILFDSTTITPCPACNTPESRLGVLDTYGKCYGCGKVELDTLYDYFLEPASIKEDA